MIGLIMGLIFTNSPPPTERYSKCRPGEGNCKNHMD